jgi:hypothetical protein
LALLATACGTSQEQRAATGGLGGAGIGALAGGPVGAAIGLGVGAVAGAVTPIGADQAAMYGMGWTKETVASTETGREMGRLGTSGTSSRQAVGPGAGGSEASSATLRVTPDTVKQIQSSLQAQGMYNGPIDGVMGPQTQRAVAAYQQKQGLPQTAVLDLRTVQSLTGETGGAGPMSATRPENRPVETPPPENR